MTRQLLTVFTAAAFTSVFSQVPTNGRILHLDFSWNSTNGSYYDASGVNNTMPLITGSVAQAAGYAGQPSTAISFDGASFVSYTGGLNSIPQGNSPYSIALMVKAQNGNAQKAGFMGYGSFGNGQCNALRLSGNASVMNYWYGGATYDFSATASSPILNNWTHLAVTYDGTVRKMYVNGTLTNTMTTVGVPTYSNNTFYVGRTIESTENLVGVMDEFIMYDRALTSSEVAQISTHAFCLTSMTVSPTFGPGLNVTLNGFTNPTTVTAASASNTSTYTVTSGTTLSISNLQPGTVYTVSATSGGVCSSVTQVTTSVGCGGYAPPAGLILHLPFNGNITDMSSTGAIPSVNTGTLSSDKCGNANKAYYISPATFLKYDLSQYPTLKAGTNGKMTIVCWAKPTPTLTMNNYASMVEIGESVFLRKSYAGSFVEGGGYNANTLSGSGGYFGVVPSWSAFNDWHMYAITYDATATANNAATSVWMDTLEYAESNPTKLSDFYNKPITYTVSTTNTSLWIGGGSASSKKFTGWIDDVCIYDRVLSAQEMKELYRGNAPVIPSGIKIETEDNKRLNLYPNPAGNHLYVGLDKEINFLHVYSLSGEEFFDGKGNQLDLSSLPAGLYLLEVMDVTGAVYHGKFIKQ